MAEMAAKVMLQAVKMGTERVPDKYWERIPGMRPPKSEKEYKDTKAKIDADEAKYGRFGSDRRRHTDRERERDHTRHDDRHRASRDDQHRPRRRSQSDERRGDRHRDRNVRAERRRLERRASSFSPPHSEDEGFYKDAERRRQERRAHKYFCNDPSHQRWDRREQPAYSNGNGIGMDRPYIPMPQAGAAGTQSPYAHLSPPGSAGGPQRNPPPTYNPAAVPNAPYGQQFPIPPPPLHPQGPPHSATSSRPPSSFASYLQHAADSHRPPSAQVPTMGFSPQPSSPYHPVSAANSRPASQLYNNSRPQSPQTAPPPPPPPAPAEAPQRYFSPPPVQPMPGVAQPPPPQSAMESTAAQKYTPHGVAAGREMYPPPDD